MLLRIAIAASLGCGLLLTSSASTADRGPSTPEERKQVLEHIHAWQADPQGPQARDHFAYVLTGLGEVDRAMDYLERAVAERTGASYGIKGSFLFKPLRGHPRFSALLRQMNLAG